MVDGGRALAVCEDAGADLLVNSDVWRTAHDVCDRLFPDYRQTHAEHTATVHSFGLLHREEEALEASEWAHWHRLLQAAYVIGLSVGRRSGASGGAR
jgi:hypothetical protein